MRIYLVQQAWVYAIFLLSRKKRRMEFFLSFGLKTSLVNLTRLAGWPFLKIALGQSIEFFSLVLFLYHTHTHTDTRERHIDIFYSASQFEVVLEWSAFLCNVGVLLLGRLGIVSEMPESFMIHHCALVKKILTANSSLSISSCNNVPEMYLQFSVFICYTL